LTLATIAALFIAASAQAQVDTSLAIDTPDNVARPGAYAPVRIRATNRTARPIWEVRLTSGGPVDVTAPWRIAPGETAEKILPVFYAGGDLRLSVEFADAAGNVVANAVLVPPPVHEVPAKTALTAIFINMAEPDETAQEAVRSALGAESFRLVRLAPEAMAMALRCRMIDAVFLDARPPIITLAAFPASVEAVVQPEAARLFSSDIWPAEDRRRLWLWLGVFALAVLAGGVLVPRRKAILATVILTVIAAAATAVIFFFGDIRMASVSDARVFYVNSSRQGAAVEHFVLLQSRGGEAARHVLAQPGAAPFPLPVLAGSEDLFREGGTLHLGSEEYFENRAPRMLIHVLSTGAPPSATHPRPTREDLTAFPRRADVVAALLVTGSSAADAAGRSQPLEAWAVAWKSSADANLAYAGRSLSWWDRDRREGDAAVLLIWWRDPVAAATQNCVRLPAMAVYSE
jgi:hypothetical protein